MMSLIAQLCALCAMCTLLGMILPENRQDGMRLIGGLLMLHLVLTGMVSLGTRLAEARDLGRMIEMLLQ